MKKLLAIVIAAAMLSCAAAAFAIAAPSSSQKSSGIHLEGFVAGDAVGSGADHWIGFSSDNTTEYDSYTGFPATYAAAYYRGYVYGYVYGYDSNSELHDEFYVMDAATHFISYPEGASSEGEFVFGMAFNYVDKTMYALCNENNPYIATVDLTTGALTKVVDINLGSYLGLQTFAIDGSGNFYALTFAAISARLVKIDPSTGALTELFATGLPTFYAQSMTWDSTTNAIYWAQVDGQNTSSNGLYKIDVAAQTVTYLGQIGNNFEITGLLSIPDYVEPTPTEEPTAAPTAEPADPTALLGDVDCNGEVNFGDISALYLYLLGNGNVTAQGVINADFDQSGSADFGDISAIYLFLMGN